MGANHGAVDHLKGVWDRAALVQGVHDDLPQPYQRPAPELTVNARPFSEPIRQVAPRSTRPRDSENTIQNKAMVGGFALIRGAGGQNEAFKKRPLFVRHQVSCQAGVRRRYQLESRSTHDGNPFCQHGLGPTLLILCFCQKRKLPAERPSQVWASVSLRPSPRQQLCTAKTNSAIVIAVIEEIGSILDRNYGWICHHL